MADTNELNISDISNLPPFSKKMLQEVFFTVPQSDSLISTIYSADDDRSIPSHLKSLPYHNFVPPDSDPNTFKGFNFGCMQSPIVKRHAKYLLFSSSVVSRS